MLTRVRCREVQTFFLCAGDPKSPVEDLEPTVMFHASPYQEAKGSAMGNQKSVQKGQRKRDKDQIALKIMLL